MEVATVKQTTIAQWIHDQRLKAGWTQAQLAERLGCHQPDVSDLENGHHTPAIETMKKLAAAFGVRLHTVIAKVEQG